MADIQFNIVDTWDSTSRPITGYWVKYQKRQQRRKSLVSNKPDLLEKLTKLTVGAKVHHT